MIVKPVAALQTLHSAAPLASPGFGVAAECETEPGRFPVGKSDSRKVRIRSRGSELGSRATCNFHQIVLLIEQFVPHRRYRKRQTRITRHDVGRRHVHAPARVSLSIKDCLVSRGITSTRLKRLFKPWSDSAVRFLESVSF